MFCCEVMLWHVKDWIRCVWTAYGIVETNNCLGMVVIKAGGYCLINMLYWCFDVFFFLLAHPYLFMCDNDCIVFVLYGNKCRYFRSRVDIERWGKLMFGFCKSCILFCKTYLCICKQLNLNIWIVNINCIQFIWEITLDCENFNFWHGLVTPRRLGCYTVG